MEFIFNAGICVLIICVVLGAAYAPIWLVDREQRAKCPACQGDGGVILLPDCKGLCPEHWKRWDRIDALEKLIDWDIYGREEYERGRAELMRKLGGPLKPPWEPGAASPKDGGIR